MENEVIMYPKVNLFRRRLVAGQQRKALPVLNPATGEEIRIVAHAEKADLGLALAALKKGFETWRKVSAHERYRLMRKAADVLRSRAADVGQKETIVCERCAG
jgi:succinate-semialdehyde dehydrogenase / glutarate-semialdehyde dehydrogenase